LTLGRTHPETPTRDHLDAERDVIAVMPRYARLLTVLALCIGLTTMCGCLGRRSEDSPATGRLPTAVQPGDDGMPAQDRPTLQAWQGGWRLGPFDQVVSLAWAAPGELAYRVRYDQVDQLGRLDLAAEDFQAAVTADMYMGDALRKEFGCLFSTLHSEGANTTHLRSDGTTRDFPTAFYRLSPSGRWAVLFTAPPILLELPTSKTQNLPAAVDHGWPGYGAGLCWSPDERLLVYEDWFDHSLVILRTADGAELARIGEEGWSSIVASWSPDGRRLAFLSWPTGEPYAYVEEYDFRLEIGRRLGVYDLNTGRITYLPGRPQVFGSPVWCPGSRRVAFQAGTETRGWGIDYFALGEIWVYDVVEGTTTCVTGEDTGTSGKRPVAWSPQGDRLLVYATHLEDGTRSHVAWVVDTTTGAATQVGTPYLTQVTWLPDGRLLRASRGDELPSRSVVEVVDVSGQATRLLEGGRIRKVAVEPHGAHVAVVLEEEDGRDFVVVLVVP